MTIKQIRVGTGFDVHQLVENRPLIIGGVTLPYHLGLLGHSDADVLLHAICDALLGAVALGDIGHAFPDTDPKIKGISSRDILQNTIERVYQLGYSVSNIDATIIAEAPKMKDHLPKMRQVIAEIIDIEIDQVNIKATTMEKQGFIGEGSAIAASATVLVFKTERSLVR